jgi:hypothetical protein
MEKASTKATRTNQCANISFCTSNLEGVCSCPDGMYVDFESASCKTLKIKGEPCSSTVECNKTNILSCVGGHCNCNPQIATENKETFDINFVLGDKIIILRGDCVAKVCNKNSFSL